MNTFSIEKYISKGQFGKVFTCKQTFSDQTYAVKIYYGKAKKTSVQNEVSILTQLNHKNIVKVIGVDINSDNPTVVMEFLSGGELFTFIQQTRGNVLESVCVTIIKQIVSAVAFIHSKNILHLDLKPENVLFVDNDSWDLKLIDFGHSKKVFPNEVVTDVGGTVDYLAPEVIQSGGKVGKWSDMWSLGVIAYMLLVGEYPFSGENDRETCQNICSSDWYGDSLLQGRKSLVAANFVTRLLTIDVSKRMTAIDALNHDWLKSSSFKISNRFIADFLTWKSLEDAIEKLKVWVISKTNVFELINQKL